MTEKMVNVFEETLKNPVSNNSNNERALKGLMLEKLLKADLQELLAKIFNTIKVQYKYSDVNEVSIENDDIVLNLKGGATNYYKKAREVEDSLFFDINNSIKNIEKDYNSLPNIEEKQKFLNRFLDFDNEIYNNYFGTKIINEYVNVVEEMKEEIINIFTLKKDLSFNYYNKTYNIEIKKYNKSLIKSNDNMIMYSEPFSSYSKGGTKKVTKLYNFFLNLLRIYCFYKFFSSSKEVIPGEKVPILKVEKAGDQNAIILSSKNGVYVITNYQILASIKYVNYHISLENLNEVLGNLPRLTLYFSFNKDNVKTLSEYFLDIFPEYQAEIEKILKSYK